jgi:hypothetical protein
MSDTVKRVAMPTLGGVLIASWVLGVDSTIVNTIFGLFIASVGLPILGLIGNALGIQVKKT